MYPSRVDGWLAVVLAGAPSAVVITGIFTLNKSVGAGAVAIVTGLLVGGLIAALSLPSVCILSDQSLKIKSGLLEEESPLGQIRGAEKCFSLWSSPSLSFHRVKITLAGGTREISPRDRDGFIADLHARLQRLQEPRINPPVQQPG